MEIMIIIGFIGLSVLHSVEMSTYVNMSLQSIGTCSVCWGLNISMQSVDTFSVYWDLLMCLGE